MHVRFKNFLSITSTPNPNVRRVVNIASQPESKRIVLEAFAKISNLIQPIEYTELINAMQAELTGFTSASVFTNTHRPSHKLEKASGQQLDEAIEETSGAYRSTQTELDKLVRATTPHTTQRSLSLFVEVNNSIETLNMLFEQLLIYSQSKELEPEAAAKTKWHALLEKLDGYKEMYEALLVKYKK